MLRLIILGAPGSGKGTHAALLSQSLRIPHICIGNVLREHYDAPTELGMMARHYMRRGELVPDELALQITCERLEQECARDGWILDGFPGKLSQAHLFDEWLFQRRQRIDCVINLQAPIPVLLARLLKRGRPDDQETLITHRLKAYARQSRPVLNFYRDHGLLRAVDANGAVESVHIRLLSTIADVSSARPQFCEIS